MYIFESHAHYDDEAYDEDRDALLSSLPENGIGKVVNVCAAPESLDATVRLLEKYPFVYGAVGLHPDEVGALDDALLQRMEQLCRLEKVVAVGEIGLDYHWNTETHEKQISCFLQQLDLARRTSLPVIIHSREACADTLDLAKQEKLGDIGGVIHCFSYEKEIAREYLNMGMYLGIGGVLTYKNARKLKEVVTYAPLSQLLLETDCPYLAPVPNRGKRNSSLNIPYIVTEIAQLKDISEEEVIETTQYNAEKMFGLV